MTNLEIMIWLLASICFIGMILLLTTNILTYLPKKLKFLSTKLICKILASKIFYYIIMLWHRRDKEYIEKFKASRENLKEVLSKK